MWFDQCLRDTVYMKSEFVYYVHQFPPRCIAGLNPKPTEHFKPTILLPPYLSVYRAPYDVSNTASFIIGCPCGNRALHLLGYSEKTKGSYRDRLFVGSLRLECPKCGTVSEFFDTRNHGYDGEQGVNTHITGEGNPERFACPACGVVPMILCSNFSYQGIEDFQGEARKRLQDFFGTMDLVGQCSGCNALVEITSFECA